MGLLLTFVLSYVVTTIVYYLWYVNRNNMERNEFIRKLLYFSLSVAMMITAMYYFVDELDILFVVFAYIGVVMVTDNVLVHTYFPKGTIDTKAIDYFLPGIINTAICFGLVYMLLF